MYDARDKMYCYPKTVILKNKLNIKDDALLNTIERETSDAQALILEKHIANNSLERVLHTSESNDALLRAIHHFLFKDIYPFAGELRKVKIAKGETAFCFPQNIKHELEKLFLQLKKEEYLNQYDHREFVDRLAFYLTELNMIHPFREGNGRVMRIFSNVLAVRKGYYINYKTIQDQYLDVMIKSILDHSYLTALINKGLVIR